MMVLINDNNNNNKLRNATRNLCGQRVVLSRLAALALSLLASSLSVLLVTVTYRCYMCEPYRLRSSSPPERQMGRESEGERERERERASERERESATQLTSRYARKWPAISSRRPRSRA